VIYDEIERFPSYQDDQFNYPFESRKNIIRSLTVRDVSEVVEEDDGSGDYSYYSQIAEF
jgi:hypothetical protein